MCKYSAFKGPPTATVKRKHSAFKVVDLIDDVKASLPFRNKCNFKRFFLNTDLSNCVAYTCCGSNV